MARPIFPLERFPMKRTGSMGSCVGPEVTSTRRPVRGPAEEGPAGADEAMPPAAAN